MNRIKKILIYLIICTCFIFCFLFGKYINTLAYFENSNTFGVYPAKLDIDNYNVNLYDNSVHKWIINGNTIDNLMYTDTGFTFDIIKNSTASGVYFRSNDLVNIFGLELGETYTFTLFYDISNTNFNNIRLQFCGIRSNYFTSTSGNISVTGTLLPDNAIAIYVNNVGSDTSFPTVVNTNIMITKGDKTPTNYSPFFKFGNRVGYQLNLYNPTSSNITTNVKINNYDKQIVSRVVTINANSYYELKGNISTNSQGTIDTTFYLPYNISNDGTISFDYKLSIIIDNTNIVIKSDENISSDTYFYFEPVFNAYYKGVPTNNLYFKNSYTFNSISYIGMNANGNGLNDIYFSCVGEEPNKCIQDSIFINPNTNKNILANNVISTGIRNNINFDEVFLYNYTSSYGYDWTDTLFSFQLNIGNTNDSISSGVIYNVNISNISLNVINDNSTSSSLPNNPNTINKYNTCDAWYDIPCQLGNAVTYVIYEAPIISPIISFFDSFIDLIGSLVTYITWFEGLGLIFGVFIVIFFIRMIILLVKGGNDD